MDNAMHFPAIILEAIRRYRWHVIALSGAGLLFVFVALGRAFPYSPDSADYIEQARSLYAHGTALSTPYDLGRTEIVSEPSNLFPVGFPIVLALLLALGIEPAIGAVVVNGLSAILAPVVLFVALTPSCGSRLAAIASLLCATTPGLIGNAPFAMTDTFTLALSLLVFHLSVNSRTNGAHFLSGAIAAFSYVSRNALVALLLSSMIFYVYMIAQDRSRSDLRRQFLHFTLGLSVILTPYILYNLAVHGSINPYSMGKSTIGIAENSASMLGALAYDLSSLASLQEIIRPIGTGSFFVLLASTILAPCVLILARRAFNEPQWRALVFSTEYVLIGIWIVIVARSKYQWGDTIDTRHTLQYVPYVIGTTCIAIAAKTGTTPIRSSIITKLSLLFLTALLLVHARFFIQQLHGHAEVDSRFNGLHVYALGRDFACNKEDGTFVVSNWAYVFRIKCAVPARHLWIIDPEHDEAQRHFIGTAASHSSLKQALDFLVEHIEERPIAVALFPGKGGLSRMDFPMQEKEVDSLSNEGWTIVRNTHEKILLEH